MQAHAQLSGQAPGQVAAQNMNSLPPQGGWRRTWQTDSDLAIRRTIVEKILQLFQKRKPRVSQDWQQRLPDFVKRLEESLYRDASSKEEYADLSTLEHRLQAVAKRIAPPRNNTNFAARGINASSSSMIPTPGMPSAINGSTMIPTPGNEINIGPMPGSGAMNTNPSGMGNMLPSNSGNSMLQGQGMTSAGKIGAVQIQQQQYNSGSSGHMYRNINGQLGGSMASNIQRKSPFGFVNGGSGSGVQLMSNGQHLVNGNPGFPNTAMYMNPLQFGNTHVQSQQPMNQQRQQHMPMQSALPGQMVPIPGEGFSMNTTDLGPSCFYNQVSTGLSTSGLGMHSQGLQTSTMIPVPGLPSQQSNVQSQHQHQLQSQALDPYQQRIGRDQQQQQLQKANTLYQPQISSELYGQNQVAAALQQREETQTMPGSLSSQNSTFQSPTDNQRSHHLQQSKSLANQLPQHASHQQTTTTVLQQQQQMTQQAQSASQQQLWHNQAQSEQHQQQICKPQQQHQQLLQPSQTQQAHLQQHQPQFSQNQQQYNHLQQQQRRQDVSLQGPRELQQQKPQESKSSQQTIIQQPLQVSPPQQQDVKHDDVEEPHRSQQVAANGPVSVPMTANGMNATAMNSSRTLTTDEQRAQQYLKQQRWLLFLRHASRCTASEGQCQAMPHCHTARQLWAHISKCTDRECQYLRCQASRTLLRHHHQCRDLHCPVCGPVRQKCVQQRVQTAQGQTVQGQNIPSLGMEIGASGASRVANAEASSNKFQALPTDATTLLEQPLAKRPKVEPTEQVDVQQGLSVGVAKSQISSNLSRQAQTVAPLTSGIKTEAPAVKIDNNATVKSEDHGSTITNVAAPRLNQMKPEISNQLEAEPGVKEGQPMTHAKSEPSCTGSHKSVQVKQEVKQELVASALPSPGPDLASNAKSIKSKIKGVSLTELFTPEQIREHIVGLRQWVGQSKAKAEKNQAMEHRMSENSCQLCAVETLTFEPPPIYCTPCGARIKRNAPYWTMQYGETRHYICIPCHNDARSDTVEVDGVNYPKSKLERRKNDEETEEPWVQCDKCEKWQHQVCALFNMRRNEGGQAEYTCPQCLIGEIEKGERKPLPQSAVLGAKDLPRTLLSDHIEQWLSRRLKHERHERARAQGKGYDEVPGADSLVIRVVSSIDKKLEVKQRFLEVFQEEDYPTEFSYKSKVLLLFQKIEGVEVCLFGMYVQEFGVECAQPNQRRVYLSYLDSVKYFRPDVRTVTGEALRTFVYHEILIGYLDYCKKRGFTSCYIWACPPLKGEDYILYCHPEIQKTPKSDKLREWYLTMLRKAADEKIVVEVTNMYDHFFACNGEAKAKITAARLPYFDGDYWPGAAEDMIMQLREEEDGRRQQKKGKTKKTAPKRATKTAAQAELASNASKDLQLMQKLGESIFPMKEDFIMVHLHYACTHCCSFIISGHRWFCKQCKNVNLCDWCYDAEKKRDELDRHPINSKEAHQLVPVEIVDAVGDTKDKDEIMESEFFDTRQAFLSLCQGNHYQYDTLRRAKHSSMMVLYHLHNPTAPAFVTTCNMCHRDIETGQGWRCETCPDFDLCSSCYSKDDSVKHPHKLSPHPSIAEREAQSKEARQQRVLQLRKMLDLLVHASQCGSSQCHYPNCRRVKGLFRHGMNCKTRASGGCHLCKKMWYLLQLHARACKECECRVPRCKDLKEHLRRLQRQMESRRRAAVMEMMRQRTAETSGGMG